MNENVKKWGEKILVILAIIVFVMDGAVIICEQTGADTGVFSAIAQWGTLIFTAIAVAFGKSVVKENGMLKAENAAMKAAGLTAVPYGSNVTPPEETEEEKNARIINPGNVYVATCKESTCQCRFTYVSKHIVRFESGNKSTVKVICPRCGFGNILDKLELKNE